MRPRPVGQLIIGAVIAALFCLPLGIVSIVMAALALGHEKSDPTRARNYVRWAMWFNIASGVVGVGIVVFIVVVELLG